MDVNILKDKVSAAEAKVKKCKNTILRHEAQLEKKINAAVKLGCEVRGLSEAQLKEYKDTHHNSLSQEQLWAVIDVSMKFDDIKGARSKLADAELILQNWKDKLSKAIEQDRLIEESCPAVIKEFLERWKIICTRYYEYKYNAWPEFVQALREEEKDARLRCLHDVAELGAAHFAADNELDGILWARTSLFKPAVADDVKIVKLNAITESYSKAWAWYCENKESSFVESRLINIYPSTLMDAYLKSLCLDWKSIADRKREFGGELLLKMVEFRDEVKAFDFLEMALEAEKKAKILDLMTRIEKITGKIVDAEYLKIGPKGDLEGIIIGEKGKAKINTIGAGGYNIQCYHFRTLIHEYKDKGLDGVLADAKERAGKVKSGEGVHSMESKGTTEAEIELS